MKKVKLPTDLNKKAKAILDLVTGENEDTKDETHSKDPLAIELGRRGGLKGGKARADKLTPERRKEIAKIAAAKRWGKK